MQGKKGKQAGFTIIELMIAMALGILLTWALVQVLSNTQQISRVETSLSRLQETGRFAIDLLVSDLRLAGYQGCADPNELDLTVMAKKYEGGDLSTNAILGFETNSTTGAFSPTLGADYPAMLQNVQKTTSAGLFARPGTDVVYISFANPLAAELADPTANSSNVKLTANPAKLSQGDFAIISDCKSAHVFDITNVTNGAGTEVTFAHGSTRNNTNKITPGYEAGAHLLGFVNRTYFVADTGRVSDSGATVYALYMKEFDETPQELLEGVENLQLQYGQQLSTGNIRYVSADDSDLDFTEVVSVRIGLLAQSFDQVTGQGDTRTYFLPGESVTSSSASPHAGDSALRKPFTASVKLRNRRQEI